MRFALLALAALALSAPADAQQSPNYRLSDYAFDTGGAAALESPGFRLTLVTVGAELAGGEGTSPGYGLDVGYVTTYPPPGAVFDLRFDGLSSLIWAAERSAGTYNLYRGDLATGLPSDYGSCLDQDLSLPVAIDTAAPASDAAFFYLVTVTNRLGEEGTKGEDSLGNARPNVSPCP